MYATVMQTDPSAPDEGTIIDVGPGCLSPEEMQELCRLGWSTSQPPIRILRVVDGTVGPKEVVEAHMAAEGLVKIEQPIGEQKAEEPQIEQPIEEQKAEEPQIEQPKFEEPQIEQPVSEEQKAEALKIEHPVPEEPKAEALKIEEPNDVADPSILLDPEVPDLDVDGMPLHDPFRDAVIASGPDDAAPCISEIWKQHRYDLLLDPAVWAAIAPATESQSRTVADWPGQKSQYNQWRRLLLNPIGACRDPMVVALFQFRQMRKETSTDDMGERFVTAVEDINQRAEELHVETREVIVTAVQAQFEKHMGNEEDPDVTIPRLKLQLEACKCLKKHRREEKKREAEEANKARQDKRARR